MISFPNCKINLGLNILKKRPDGFHDLETVFYPIPLTDVLEITEAENDVQFSISGLKIPNTGENLCLKAYHLVKKDFPNLPPVNIHLHKAIPAGAGLGGGSSDAAFMLKMLSQKFDLAISDQQLKKYALELGSDCPFFLVNKPSLATGRGEVIEEIPILLKGYTLMLINPAIHISTKDAFATVVPQSAAYSLKEIIQQPPTSWNAVRNDFEVATSTQYPEIKIIKDDLYKAGAIYAAMSGSGSTVFGIFHKKNELPLAGSGYFNKAFTL